MSRKPSSSYVPLLLCAAIIVNAECAGNFSDRCLDLVRLDVDDIENHLDALNLTDVPTVKMMTAGFKCPIPTLPFGTLKSDWARLLLLQEAQPEGSIIRLKLVRLMRILIIAYYQMEERIDIVDSEDAKIAKKSPIAETKIAAKKTSQCASSNNSSRIESSENNPNPHHTRTNSSLNDAMPSATENGYSRVKSNATMIEVTTMRNFSSLDGTTSTVSPDATRRNVSIDLGAASTKKNVTFDDCLRQSLKDIVRKRSSRKDIARNKAKWHSEFFRATRKNNEIDDRDRTFRPPTNEFWQYVTFPTKAPLTVGSVASRLKAKRKSQKRAKLSNDVYESFRRFYGVDKNEKDIK
ncbi:uncharacterized protein LOC105432039 [Pogonomyrmex barbatus]|uniref:Uncharacterized protein LOC105432039 n=1 Tax=Pogonomyrmex barbatus TaxID=144034 RepID=A0A6I9WY14_9HYME|nr:uncharacterized protein LOC105432039 [Pogonomyrmex barbatus]